MSNPFPPGFQNSEPPSFWSKARNAISNGSSAGDHRRAIEMAALQHQQGLERILAQGDNDIRVGKKLEKSKRKTLAQQNQWQSGENAAARAHETTLQSAQFGESARVREFDASEHALDRGHSIKLLRETGRQERSTATHNSKLFLNATDKLRQAPKEGESDVRGFTTPGGSAHFVRPTGPSAPSGPANNNGVFTPTATVEKANSSSSGSSQVPGQGTLFTSNLRVNPSAKPAPVAKPVGKGGPKAGAGSRSKPKPKP